MRNRTGKAARSLGALAAILRIGAAPLLWWPARGSAPIDLRDMPVGDGISVMTYNVEGLPWPLRFGRAEAASEIAARLRTLRDEGRQPHIVVLQEAFTAAAKNIGADSGYPYAAIGPSRDLPGEQPATGRDADHIASRSFFRGERSGKLLDSGLMILSDYPIVAVRRIAFPAFACAGYDCLANKGAVMASIAVPGAPAPINVVDVHLNSSGASGVQAPRALYAFQRQIDALGRFVDANHDPRSPLIVAGDLNVGQRPKRIRYFTAQPALWGAGLAEGGASAALQSCASRQSSCKSGLPADARLSLALGKDWQIFRAGSAAALSVEHIAVPFGRARDGTMLSDHVGYTAYYRISSRL